MTITLHSFNTYHDEQLRRYSCEVKSSKFPTELFFEGKSSIHKKNPNPSANWAVIAMLYPAMAAGEDLDVNAPVSSFLLYKLNNDIQALLIAFQPSLSKIRVTAKVFNESKDGNHKLVATGFSAGVDTFTTLALYYSGEHIPIDKRISSLTVFNVGAMGSGNNAEDIYQQYSKRVRSFSENNQLDWQTVTSNLDTFYVRLISKFQMTHVVRNVAAAYIFEDLYSCYYYSSSYPYVDINKGNDDMSFIEPILLPLLESEELRFYSSGAGLSRLDKTEIISDYEPATQLLDVCVGNVKVRIINGNCSKCWKCSRTIVILDILGKIDDFSKVFDIEYYNSNRRNIVLKIFENAIKGNPIDRDLIRLMKEKNFKVDISYIDKLLLKIKHLAKIKHLIGIKGLIRERLSNVPLLKAIYRYIKAQLNKEH